MELEHSRRSAAMVHALTDRWWATVLRGAAAILFGVLTFVSPGTTLLAIVFVWATYAVLDGALNLVVALRHAGRDRLWGWLLFQGAVSIAAGVVTFVYPGLTAMLMIAVIATWAVLTGIAEIASAVRLRKHIEGEWLLASAGGLSIAFGVLLYMFPRAGGMGLLFMIGAYAIAFGILCVALGFRLRSWHKRTGERVMPSEGIPAH